MVTIHHIIFPYEDVYHGDGFGVLFCRRKKANKVKVGKVLPRGMPHLVHHLTQEKHQPGL